MQHDVIVVGGSYAGMAAALQLARARRSVLVIDAGLRRNRFSPRSHGFLGQDGADPAQIARTARRQLEAYPTLTWVEGSAETASGTKDRFVVTTREGAAFNGRRLLFALGVTDELPPIDGLEERWGVSVFQCPYCHGYELDRGEIGVIATKPDCVQLAQLIAEWGRTTLLSNAALTLDDDARNDLAARGVAVEETAIDRIGGHAEVVLADGRRLSFAGIFTATRTAPSTRIAEALGCELVGTATGRHVAACDEKETCVPGVFACGDAAHSPHSLSLAVADGALAGSEVHKSLVWPDGDTGSG